MKEAYIIKKQSEKTQVKVVFENSTKYTVSSKNFSELVLRTFAKNGAKISQNPITKMVEISFGNDEKNNINILDSNFSVSYDEKKSILERLDDLINEAASNGYFKVSVDKDTIASKDLTEILHKGYDVRSKAVDNCLIFSEISWGNSEKFKEGKIIVED